MSSSNALEALKELRDAVRWEQSTALIGSIDAKIVSVERLTKALFAADCVIQRMENEGKK